MQLLLHCGGLGTRLRPFTETVPKPMLILEGKPFLEYLIRYYASQGIRAFVLTVGYLKEQIIDYFGNGKAWDVRIDYVAEDTPLGTGGALKAAEKLLAGTFFVANGDTFVELSLAKLAARHKGKEALGTIAVKEVSRKQNSGRVRFDQNRQITSFASQAQGIVSGYISAGVYCLSKDILSLIPAGRVSLEDDVFAKITHGLYVYLLKPGYFIDIGTFDTYNQLQKESKRLMNAISGTH